MAEPNRRQWLSGAGALVAAPTLMGAGSALAAGEGTGPSLYDYVFFELAPGSPPYRRPAPTLGPILHGALQTTHGKNLGLFVPQLGWSTLQAAALLAWPDDDGRAAAVDKLRTAPDMTSVRTHRLVATARPAKDSVPLPGGIYVHRWFVIDAAATQEFVALSVQGWVDFENRFDARIFGLFADERSAEDLRQGVVRLFLLTRYRDHGVWQASRDPTTEAMKAFARRQALTHVSWAASTLLIDI